MTLLYLKQVKMFLKIPTQFLCLQTETIHAKLSLT